MSEMMARRVARAICDAHRRALRLPPATDAEWEVERALWEPRARDAIEAHEAVLEEAGMVIVPREPTPAMLKVPIPVRDLKASGFGESVRLRVWRLMVDAAKVQ